MAIKNLQIYQERRNRLANMIGVEGVILVPGATPALRNGDVDYPFRQDSNFLYLTGFTEPDALLVIMGGETPRSILLCHPKDREREIWTGKRFGPKGAKKEFGFDQAVPITSLEQLKRKIAPLLHQHKAIYYPEPWESGALLRELLTAQYLARNMATQTPAFIDSDSLLSEMRLIKDGYEIEIMAKAATISALTHREVLALVHPDMTEVALEAEFTYRFRKAGGDPCHAYPSIVATGKNACTLHHLSTNARIKDGDLVLVDAGCEYEGYASDITRTFPANGVFTNEQRAIYAIVLAAQKAAIALAGPGVPFSTVHDKATEIICKGLMALGLLEKTKLRKALEKEVYRAYFPHRTSHWLGIDVHDVGDYQKGSDGQLHRLLEPGMVLTVEPGIYIQPNNTRVGKKWRGIGVRIEDDVLITETGNTVLSAAAPKEIAEIEKLMKY